MTDTQWMWLMKHSNGEYKIHPTPYSVAFTRWEGLEVEIQMKVFEHAEHLLTYSFYEDIPITVIRRKILRALWESIHLGSVQPTSQFELELVLK